MPHYAQTWDLDCLFQGGSQSPQVQTALQDLNLQLEKLKEAEADPSSLKETILTLQACEGLWGHLHSYIICLVAQNTDDLKAMQLHDQLDALKGELDIASNQLYTHLQQLSDTQFEKLIQDPALKPILFSLKEKRSWTKELLPLEQENLIQRLSLNGYRGWMEFYSTWIGKIQIPFTQDGKTVSMSVGQVENKLTNADRTIRQAAFQTWQSTWETHQDLFAHILNQLGGFRLQTYQARGWPSVLKEPLFYNRMHQTTLNCMWTTIQEYKPFLVQYFQQKAQDLGLDRLSWYDVDAPLPRSSLVSISFDEAAETIVKEFQAFSPRLSQFAQRAFKERWIEAEDRPKKRPGGFCTELTGNQQSRIFMTYGGSLNNLFTLAHELGHAYHNEVVKELPIFSQQYAMNVAETASTMAEMIVVDSALKQTSDPHQRRALLDSKLQRAATFLMNIHARFLFETRFYEARQHGTLMATQLNALMESAQKDAYCNTLGEWYPQFWVSKGHFYMTQVPFYNFPYTFGYLFSLGIYARSLKEGPSFAKNYDALLLDTGRMTVEDLALRHLQVDLTQPHFWREALDLVKEDAKSYIESNAKN